MKRKNIKKESLNEGLYDRFIDGFFGALKKGVADSFQKKAEKAGIPDEMLDHMKEMEDHFKKLEATIQKHKKGKN